MSDLIFRSSITLRTQYGGGTTNYDVISAVSDSNGAAASITTDALPGDAVGITSSATISGQSVTYELTNSANGKYAINSTTGVITVGLVALSAGTDTIVVRATASSGQRRTQSFTITVSQGIGYIPTLWVDGATGNDSYTRAQIRAGGGSLKWATIGRAMWGATTLAGANASEAADAGDCVVITAGVYSTSESTNTRDLPVYRPFNSGTSGNPIVFYADGIVEPRTTVGAQGGIGVGHQDYITFAGSWYYVDANNQAGGESGGFVFWDANYCILDGATILGQGAGTRNTTITNYSGVYIEDCTYIEIRNCDISYYGDHTNVQTQENAPIATYSAAYCTFENNILHHGNKLMYIKGYKNIVQEGNVVRKNKMHTGYKGIALGIIGSQHGAASYGNNDWTDVYQNLLYDITYRAVEFMPFNVYSPRRIRVVNNTFIRIAPTQSAPVRDWAVFGFRDPSGTNTSMFDYIQIKNNLSYDVSESTCWGITAAMTYFNPNGQMQYNGYYLYDRESAINNSTVTFATLQGTYGLENNVLTSDPLFTNYAGSDFTLSGSSPALGYGVDILNLKGGGTSAAINLGCYILADQSDVIGVTP